MCINADDLIDIFNGKWSASMIVSPGTGRAEPDRKIILDITMIGKTRVRITPEDTEAVIFSFEQFEGDVFVFTATDIDQDIEIRGTLYRDTLEFKGEMKTTNEDGFFTMKWYMKKKK
jgi:hypothetical protein